MDKANFSNVGAGLVSVCVCTFRRPEGVINAIKSIVEQEVPGGWQMEIVVVDNDRSSIIGDVIRQVFVQAPDSVIRSVYVVEEHSGVSFARNRCLLEARGDLIAFIDDDEQASPLWLQRMLTQLEASGADAVFGPILSMYAKEPPLWLKACAIQDHFRYPSGKQIGWGATRTGNVLFRRSLLEKVGQFESRFARTGSEDTFFFCQAESRGARFVWCDDAIVMEHVPSDRMSKRWVFNRYFTGGRNYVLLRVAIYGSGAYFSWWLHGFVMILAALPITVVLLLIGHSSYMRFACKMFGGLGKMAAPFYHGGDYAAPG